MNEPRKISIVLPSHNEAESMADMVRRIRAVDPSWEIVVVDDASSDDTSGEARKAGADKVVRHTYNLGNGASVVTGAKNASGDIVVFMDADGQHPPEAIPELLKYFPDYDMVIGSRTRKSKTHWFRNLGNFLLVRVAEMLSKHKISDLTSGFRAVKKEAFFEFRHLYPLRYSYPTTITLAMLCSGRFVKFEPVDGIKARSNGKSGISPFMDGFRFLNIIVRIILLFHPARVFIPAALFIFALGVISGALQLMYVKLIGNITLLLFQTSFLCFIVGIISEQISFLRQRSR